MTEPGYERGGPQESYPGARPDASNVNELRTKIKGPMGMGNKLKIGGKKKKSANCKLDREWWQVKKVLKRIASNKKIPLKAPVTGRKDPGEPRRCEVRRMKKKGETDSKKQKQLGGPKLGRRGKSTGGGLYEGGEG